MTNQKISWTALLIGVSVVGAMLKIPAIIGSVALDAFPALLAAVMISNPIGAIVGGMGHLLSALLGGFSLGPLHILIALEMAFLVWLFGKIYRAGLKITASLVFLIGNTLLAPLPFLFLFSMEFYLALLPSLFVGSLFNVILAILLIPRLLPIFNKLFAKNKETEVIN